MVGITKSIAKWTYKNFNEDNFREFVVRTHKSELQAERGRKGGLIGGKIGKGGGRPDVHGKIWEKLGVSRATWYRNLRGYN